MKEENTNPAASFPSLLLLVFITLKLCGVIDWSWWWVLSPLWISFVILSVFMITYSVVRRIMDEKRR